MKYLKYFESIIDLDFTNKKISTLIGLNIPKYVDGDFNCSYCTLTSLDGCAEKIDGDFNCSYCGLITLEGCAEKIGGDFNCSWNSLKSFDFCAKSVGRDFDCSNNILTSLEFCPRYIGGDFSCYSNELTSFEHIPEFIGGVIYCDDNNWTNPISYEYMIKYTIIDSEKYKIYTEEQEEEFRSYDFQKDFLTKTPEKYKDLEYLGYNKQIKEEFDWIFNASDMGLM